MFSLHRTIIYIAALALLFCGIVTQAQTTTTITPDTTSDPLAPPSTDPTISAAAAAGITDPGPRPAGGPKTPNCFASPGPTRSNNTTLLVVPVPDCAQPPDALGNEGAGNVLNNAGVNTGTFWFNTIGIFGQVASVDGSVDPVTKNPTLKGLGPAFNGEGCFQCHSQPTVGGTSPFNNPQFAAASDRGALNTVPSFLRSTGPIREARFILDEADTSNRTLDGGVHELFRIKGRSDAPVNCDISQPDFATQQSRGNVIFRIPTPTFGLGLVENTPESVFLANLTANAADKATYGISGHFNHNGNDGTQTKFGWKAQNKSLLLFAGEAANVELGVTNEIFNNEKVPGLSCAINGRPEDNTHVAFSNGLTQPDTTNFVSAAIENFAIFMRINGAPSQCAFNSGVDANGAPKCIALDDPSNPQTAAIQRGKTLFGLPANGGIGCAFCHANTAFLTDPSDVPGLSNRLFTPFSDFALHHMGATLADGVSQGQSGPDEFRTAPLWGLGQRLFFLHDGRAGNLIQAIAAHRSSTTVCFDTNATQSFTVNGVGFSPAASTHSCGSEANHSVEQFNTLSSADKLNLLKYLRSL